MAAIQKTEPWEQEARKGAKGYRSQLSGNNGFQIYLKKRGGTKCRATRRNLQAKEKETVGFLLLRRGGQLWRERHTKGILEKTRLGGIFRGDRMRISK